MGLAALNVRYAPVSGAAGKVGLAMSFVGMVMLTAGHLYAFALVIPSVLALIAGPVLFGIAALDRDVPPRRWRYLPLATGTVGFVWIFVTTNDTGELTVAFVTAQTLFALGWLLLGFVLWSDRRVPVGDPMPAGQT